MSRQHLRPADAVPKAQAESRQFIQFHFGKAPLPAGGQRSADLLETGKCLLQGKDRRLSIRRVYVVANHVVDESKVEGVQLDLFEEPVDTTRERSRQEAILEIRRRFGKNAILTGIDFEEGATARERNNQIGGHRK